MGRSGGKLIEKEGRRGCNLADLVIKAYPSIVLSELNVATDGGDITDVQIINMAGQVVLKTNKSAIGNNGLLTLNLGTLSAATYLVRAQNTEGVVLTTKIVKQ